MTAAPVAAPASDYLAIRDGPILPTLVSLTLPNLVALCSAAIVTIAETAYVGRLGLNALGGVALVFPMIMLMQMLSAGAMGGAISGAVSRALGAGDEARAQALATTAGAIGLTAGLFFASSIWLFGPHIFRLLGGAGAIADEAARYSNVAAFGILAIWLVNCLAAVARASGNMKLPSAISLAAGVLQITIGGVLGLGIGPAPALGVAGVASGQATAFSLSAIVLILYLRSDRSRIKLLVQPRLLSRARFMDILRVGLPATLFPLQSVAGILILTALAARFGPEALAGYGIGTRLEFLLIPVAFSVGIACLPMVGTAIGNNAIARARRIAWTAGSLAFCALAVLGAIVIIAPDLWARLFTSDRAVREATHGYLQIAGFGFPFFGLGTCLYFASQGAGRVGGLIAAQTLRLVVIAVGGAALSAAGAPLWTLFALAMLGMLVLGLGAAAAVYFTPWTVRR